MAAGSFKSVALDRTQYLDVVALATAQSESISGLDLTFQNMGAEPVLIFFGGASAPTGRQIGHKINPGQTIFGGAVDHVWAKGSGDLSFWVS